MATKLNLFNNKYTVLLKIISFAMLVTLSVTAVVGCTRYKMFSYDFRNLGKSEWYETDNYLQWIYEAGWCGENICSILNGDYPDIIRSDIDNLFMEVDWQITEKLINDYNARLKEGMTASTEAGIQDTPTPQNDNDIYATPAPQYRQDEDWQELEDDEGWQDDENYVENYPVAENGEISPNYPDGEYYYPTDEERWAEFERQYAARIKEFKKRPEAQLEYWLNHLTYDDTTLYYIEVGNEVLTNTKMSFEELSVSHENAAVSGFQPFFGDVTTTHRYAIAKTPEYIEKQNGFLRDENIKLERLAVIIIIWFLLFAATVVLNILLAGRSANTDGIKLTFFDKIFNEITVVLVLGALILGEYICRIYYHEGFHHRYVEYICVTLITLGFIVGYSLLLSPVRHIKNKSFLKNFLLYKFAKGFVGFAYSKSNPVLRTMILVTVLGVLTMIPYIGILSLLLGLILTFKYAKDFKEVRDGVIDIRNGIYNREITLSDSEIVLTQNMTVKTDFAALADDINHISAGLSDEVERRLKSERLKTDLIVNISHDIRTPLTSLITYSDLLLNEKTDNENIKKYAEVISSKSNRLKVLTDDLFESSKAATGNISVNLEDVEVNALLVQALAEFNEKIKQSELEIKLNLPEEPVTVRADGKLLWRVIENLMTNALRYSLENTRVYIDVKQDDDNVIIEMKNISKTALNIPADEITERFRRGDESRNSEGSGLGLDIASSLMKCQGGRLEIKIDGDLFKVCCYCAVADCSGNVDD